MRTGWIRACAAVLVGTVQVSAAEPGVSLVETPTVSRECEPPDRLPPLLQVPAEPMPPVPGPAGPKGDYDPGYFYLPERAPENAGPNACGPAGRFWIAPGLELAWMKSERSPNLVRVGSPTGPIAYGGRQATMFTPGFSLTGGFWLNQEHTRGFDASFFYLPQTGVDTNFFSNGSTLLLPTANGGSFPLANADYAGAFQAGWNTRFASADMNYRNTILCSPDGRIDAIVGYRYAGIDDTASLYSKRLGPDGQIVRTRDDINASNQFHGGQIGLAGEYRVDRWYISGSGKVAFGAMFTDTDLEGKFRVNGVVAPVGFYARPGVDGTREHTNFAVMPVVGVTLGRQITDHSRVFLGYNFLYVNSLIRAPDVIDPTPTVSTANPQAPLASASPIRRDSTTSDFWVQSLSFGLQWRY